jgi:single-strand DNA-binding protein|uniref:Single-stranded DNA-binding protein n=1 Tax=candidate division WOR-3 bacterium TaxID=2052148 RepID=A0A7C6EKR0_UNCW3
MNQLRLGYLNSVYLIGRLVADPELRYTQKGAPVCSFRIATTRRFKNRESGETHEETLFVTIVAWRRQAELVNDFLKKGSAVLIEGRLRSRQWETETKEKRSTVEVVAHRIQFLDLPESGSETGANTSIEAEEEIKEEDNIDTPF